MTTTAVRTIGDVEVPAPGIWQIDPGHAEIGFVGRHFGLTRIRGRFTEVEGTITIAEEPESSTVDVTLQTASVDSGDEARDGHLRSEDFFDAASFPEATFRSTGLQIAGTTAVLTGELTIKSVSRTVTLDVEYLGHARDPWDNDRAVFSARGRVNREDWGLTWNMPLAAGGWLVSKEIHLEIEVELIRQ